MLSSIQLSSIVGIFLFSLFSHCRRQPANLYSLLPSSGSKPLLVFAAVSRKAATLPFAVVSRQSIDARPSTFHLHFASAYRPKVTGLVECLEDKRIRALLPEVGTIWSEMPYWLSGRKEGMKRGAKDVLEEALEQEKLHVVDAGGKLSVVIAAAFASLVFRSASCSRTASPFARE